MNAQRNAIDRLDIVGMHYQLCGYVHRDHIDPSPFDGWATFTTIVEHRPAGCRFAVARRIPIVPNRAVPGKFTHGEPTGAFVVWDISTGFNANGEGLLTPPAPVLMGENEDGLVMRAMTLYDR